ncbi:hypothetical protein [Sorangium sp. So ce426]|uniref:hypothetical protein n=1 Tax=unclassified Sorangium TaxID=2621164 RepID=UPI003F5C2A64
MSPRPALASFALVTGIVLLLGGTAHAACVLAGVAKKGVVPHADRAAHLAFISFAQWTAGALDVLAARGLGRGEPWTRGPLTISGLLVIGWAGVALPLPLDASLTLRAMLALYAAAHLGLLAALWGSRGARLDVSTPP